MNDIKSNEILPNTNIRVKFLCIKCGYGYDGEWEATPNSRVQMKTGCKKCHYNWVDGKKHSKEGPALAEKGVDDLQSQHPELVKEIHPTLTNINPSKVKVGSHIKIDWLCPYCNYTWKAMVYSRVAQKSGCPRCHYNWYKAETGQPQNIKSQYRKPTTPSKPKSFKIVELSDIDKEMQSWDF